MAVWPVVGHEWALQLLAQAVHTGRLSHAYLFTGPPQIGKTTVAQSFAQALVCERSVCEDGVPCGECRACQRVAQRRYPDVQFVTAEKNTIQIDQVRAILTDAAIAPLEGLRKVFVISEIERATLPAANALLKTLEEPPDHVVLLLTASRRDLVLPTILSRCQIVGLRPLGEEQIRGALMARWGIDDQQASLLARLSAGRLGWAVTAQAQPEVWQARTKYLNDLMGLTAEGYIARLAYAEVLSGGGAQIEVALGLWAGWWRDVMLIQHHLPDQIVNLDLKGRLEQQAELFRPEQVQRALGDLMQTLRRIKANVNARLALDVLMLRLPRPAVG